MRQMVTEGLCMMLVASFPALLVCLNLTIMELMPTEHMDFMPSRFLLNTVPTYLLFMVAILLST